jgi:Glycosyl transferase family 2
MKPAPRHQSAAQGSLGGLGNPGSIQGSRPIRSRSRRQWSPRVSVVIPTSNEQPWLPRLLACLAPIRDRAEVIVADAGSSDQTALLAERLGCRVVRGGRPAEGRNRGAEVSRTQNLLFIDADAYPSRPVLAHSMRQVRTSTSGLTCYKHLPISDDWFVRASYAAADLWFAALRRIGVHHALTNYVLVPRSTFEAIGGFCEEGLPGEDVDFVYRSSKIAPVVYERGTPVLVSSRRFLAESPTVFALKAMVWEATILTRSSYPLFPYQWPLHDPEIARDEDVWLRQNCLGRTDHRGAMSIETAVA